MSIADEPDVHWDDFWFRVMAADLGPDPHSCNIVCAPGAPMLLTLSDGRQFVGTRRGELLDQVEA